MKGCFVCQEGGRLPYVFRNGRDSIIKSELEMPDEVITEKNYKEHARFLQGVEVIVCTWDMVPFTKEEIRAYFPNLKLVLYGAGSVQYFGRPFLELGVKIISCWQVMAKPVAQFTLAAVVLANKGALMAMRRYRTQSYQCNGLVHTALRLGYSAQGP